MHEMFLWVPNGVSLATATRSGRASSCLGCDLPSRPTIGDSHLYVDTLNKRTQADTPPRLNGALVWPGEMLEKYRKQAESLLQSIDGLLIVPTWNDDLDLSWLYDRSLRLTAHDKREKVHKRSLEIAGRQESDFSELRIE